MLTIVNIIIEVIFNFYIKGAKKMKTIVTKFGGSSLADSIHFKKVKNIIENDSNRKFVIPSAPGKRFSKDFKVTDLLYLCNAHVNSSIP